MDASAHISLYEANAMAIMGAFVLFFIIRMAGATMEQKEEAESSMRLSEDRFRSLIQNSSDATIVVGGRRGVHATSARPSSPLLGLEPSEMVGRRATDFIHPDDRERLADRLGRTSRRRRTPSWSSSA